jgi:Tfp pilus assembly protein PilN
MRNPFQRQDSGGGSFLPQDYVARKAELRANLLCLGLFGVVMFGVVAAFFVTNRQWLQVRSAQKTIAVLYTQEAPKIEQNKRLESQKAEVLEKAAITTALVEKVPRSTLLAELVTRMPKDITLLEVTLVSKRLKDPASATPAKGAAPAVKNLGAKAAPVAAAKKPIAKDGKPAVPEAVPPPKFEYTLKLIGVAKANNNITDYQTAITGCSLLDKVELKYIKEHTIDKLELRKFEIEASIRKDADGLGIAPVEKLRSAGAPGADPAKSGAGSPVVTVPGGKEEK